MLKSTNYSKVFVAFCLILCHTVSYSSGQDLSPSMIKIHLGQKYICAGILVKGDYVVTAAECVEGKPLGLLYVLGNVRRELDIAGEVSAVIDRFIPLEYNNTTKYMAIAVLKLATSIGGLPVKLCSKYSIEYGETLELYYWDTVDTIPTQTRQLKTLKYLSAVDTANCNNSYNNRFSNTTLCAMYPKAIHRISDGGGPIVIDGQVCGIYNLCDTFIGRSRPACFTSLANPRVTLFIKHSLMK